MHSLVPFIQTVAAPLVAAVDVLAPALAAADHRPFVQGNSIAASFAVSAGLIACLGIFLASWMRARLAVMKRSVRDEKARSRSELAFLEMLLNGGPQGLVVMKGAGRERLYFGEGKAIFGRLLDSPDAPRLVKAIDALTENGEDFHLCVRDTRNSSIALRGTAVGGRAVLYLCEQDLPEDGRKYVEILNSLPVPIWTRDAKMALDWANPAFLRSLGANDLDAALASNAMLDRSELIGAAAALKDGKPVVSQAAAILGGERRTLEFNLSPMPGALVCGVAFDVTDGAKKETAMQLALDAHADMMDHLPIAIAMFGADRKLFRHNRTYAELWGFSEAWLDTGPTFEEILNQLRDKRKLPEQRNFAEWKKSQLDVFDGLGRRQEQTWHLPRGKSLQITTQPYLQGGVVVLCEDISERLRLESSFNLLTQVQKATLDTLDEGVAIFGTDGRLVLHNALFAKMWKLDEEELVSQPHFAEISNLCAARIGRDGIWGIVSCGILSAAAEGFGEWGRARRADGRVFSLSLSRLPNGATVVTFADITDLERFGAVQDQAARATA